LLHQGVADGYSLQIHNSAANNLRGIFRRRALLKNGCLDRAGPRIHLSNKRGIVAFANNQEIEHEVGVKTGNSVCSVGAGECAFAAVNVASRAEDAKPLLHARRVNQNCCVFDGIAVGIEDLSNSLHSFGSESRSGAGNY
jgi:hypothetical protein